MSSFARGFAHKVVLAVESKLSEEFKTVLFSVISIENVQCQKWSCNTCLHDLTCMGGLNGNRLPQTIFLSVPFSSL